MAQRTTSPQRPRDRRYTTSPSQRSSWLTRLAMFVAISLVVLTVAAYFLWPAVRPGGPAAPGVVTVTLTMNGFMPDQIEARAGEPITLRLVNNDTKYHTDGGGWHQLAFEALRVDVNVPPETTQDFTFTPATEGTYRFYCSVCCGGKENPSMWGTLEVTA